MNFSTKKYILKHQNYLSVMVALIFAIYLLAICIGGYYFSMIFSTFFR